jgi:hypothetical protein
VGFVRIFIDPPEKLCEMLDILESHQEVGIDIYIAFPEDLPQSLHGNYIIIDDIAFAQLEFNANGEFSGQDISIDHIEVDRMIQKFDRAMEWAQELDEVKHILKQKKDVS